MSEVQHVDADRIDAAETDPRSSVIARAAVIIDAFSSSTTRWLLSDLTDFTGLPRSTVFRLVTQLVDVGWLERDPGVQGYRLGARMIAAGERYSTNSQLREAAAPLLNELHESTGLFMHLAVLEEHGRIHYLDRVGTLPGVVFPSRVGFRYPVERTSAGKAMLAMMEPAQAEDILLTREANGGIDLGWVRRELPLIRRNFGVATLTGGLRWKDTNATGAAVMGPGGPVGAIAIAGFNVELRPLAPLVLRGARRISEIMFPDWSADQRRRALRRLQAA